MHALQTPRVPPRGRQAPSCTWAPASLPHPSPRAGEALPGLRVLAWGPHPVGAHSRRAQPMGVCTGSCRPGLSAAVRVAAGFVGPVGAGAANLLPKTRARVGGLLPPPRGSGGWASGGRSLRPARPRKASQRLRARARLLRAPSPGAAVTRATRAEGPVGTCPVGPAARACPCVSPAGPGEHGMLAGWKREVEAARHQQGRPGAGCRGRP